MSGNYYSRKYVITEELVRIFNSLTQHVISFGLTDQSKTAIFWLVLVYKKDRVQSARVSESSARNPGGFDFPEKTLGLPYLSDSIF